MAASTSTIAEIGTTARTKLHVRRMRWAIVAISSKSSWASPIEGAKRTNGPASSRCDDSPGSNQDLWQPLLNTNRTKGAPTAPRHPRLGPGPYRRALICHLFRCRDAPPPVPFSGADGLAAVLHRRLRAGHGCSSPGRRRRGGTGHRPRPNGVLPRRRWAARRRRDDAPRGRRDHLGRGLGPQGAGRNRPRPGTRVRALPRSATSSTSRSTGRGGIS